MKDSDKKKIYVKTFGCQMNEYDTEKMLSLLSKEYQRVEDPDGADLVIVNTCSVREKGEHKLFGLLGRLRQLKEQKPSMVIGVGGCVVQQEGENIIKRSPSVDFVVGTHNLSLIPSLVSNSAIGGTPQVAIDYRDEWDELPDEFDALPDENSIVKSAFNTSVRALVAIQRGCDKMCSYCVVPTTRGKQVSRDSAEILKEIRLKVRMGTKEVMLLGQTVNSYGIDLSPRLKFSELVKNIADIDGVKRIRFTSPHPAEFKKDFIKLYAEVPSLCPHIHLPLQSGNNRILKIMNRNYRIERYLEIVDSLREIVPDIAITTDIIAGFPGETEEEFQDTIEIVKKVKYHSVYSFKYSQRPNTAAKQMFKAEDEVPEVVKQRRLKEFQDVQENISLEFNRNYEGQEIEILVESQAKALSLFRGRSLHNVPAEFHALETEEIKLGDIITAKVFRSSPHVLKAMTNISFVNVSDNNLSSSGFIR